VSTRPLVLPLGDAAFLLRLDTHASVASAQRAAGLAEAIRAEALAGVREVVAAGASVAVYYDPLAPDAARLEQHLRVIAAHATEVPPFADGRTHEIPVRYDGADLDEVAARCGLSRKQVVALHSAREYHVLAIGFAPGFAYLGELDPALALPRRDSPRARVPAGAVAIAGAQTGIYPRVSPGGWHLLGTTDAVLFDAARDEPSLFRAGDRVRFVPVA
jgi:KipI family sensor histidine kinase inhibitor